MQVSNRQIKADQEFAKGIDKLSWELRKDILDARILVKKTDIKKLGKIEAIKDGSIKTIEQIQVWIAKS
jgi:hypothetical protein